MAGAWLLQLQGKQAAYYLGHASLAKMRIVPAEQAHQQRKRSTPSSSCPLLSLCYYLLRNSCVAASLFVA